MLTQSFEYVFHVKEKSKSKATVVHLEACWAIPQGASIFIVIGHLVIHNQLTLICHVRIQMYKNILYVLYYMLLCTCIF